MKSTLVLLVLAFGLVLEAQRTTIRNSGDPDNAPRISNSSLDSGTEDEAYAEQIDLEAGVGRTPFTYSVASGALPDGLSLSGSTGAITGTPTTAGTSNFVIRVVDVLGGAHEKALSITIVSGQQSSTLCTDAGANARYVKVSSAGAANGSDWNNPLGASFTPSRGLTYCFADGSYGSKAWNTTASGTDVIQVVKATASDHGTDTGWTSDLGDGVATWSGWTITTDYWTFNGATGGGPESATTAGFEITRTTSACGDQGDLIGLGNGADNLTFSHINAHGGSNNYPINGVKGVGGTNSNITFSEVSIYTTFGPSFHINTWTNLLVERAYIADVRSTVFPDPLGFCDDWHAEMLSNIGNSSDLTFRWSIFEDIDGTAVFAGVNTGTYTNLHIYGNVFARNLTTPVFIYCEGGSNNHGSIGMRFFNNTIVGNIGAAQFGVTIQSGCGTTDNIIRNNIWYLNEGNAGFLSGTHSHNYASGNFRTEGCAPTCDKDADICSGGTDCQDTSGSPFVSYNADPLVADLHLSGATNAGSSTSSPTGNDEDVDGCTRTTFDRGAYEYPSCA